MHKSHFFAPFAEILTFSSSLFRIQIKSLVAMCYLSTDDFIFLFFYSAQNMLKKRWGHLKKKDIYIIDHLNFILVV